MRLRFIVLLLIPFSAGQLFAQSGKEWKNCLFKSDTLNTAVSYNIYLPPHYDSTKSYPVIYNLHWFGGNNNTSSELIHLIDSLISAKEFPACIVVAPDAKRSWYIDDYAGKYKYSSMFIYELLPYLEKRYSISKDRTKRAIMGASMGGFGALRFSMLYPDLFGICVSFMAGISTKQQICEDPQDAYNYFHHQLYGQNMKPSERANPFFIKNNPLYIVQDMEPARLRTLKWYIQCCDQDYHSLPNAALHIAMREKKIPHEFRINKGDHNGDCVNNSMKEALNFIMLTFEGSK